VKDALSWLGEFQAHFGAMLRTPLDRSRGTLHSSLDAYPRELERIALSNVDADGHGKVPSGRHRLAVYNRQYWFRLFGVLAGAFPLTARLLGHWRFNGHAARFLGQHPPCSYFIDHVSNGFADFLCATVTTADGAESCLDLDALREGVRIDDAWRMAHYAPLPIPWRLTAAEAPRLVTSRLRHSPAVHLVDETWPLVDLRGRVVEEDGEDPVPLPPRHGTRKAWAIVRRPNGVGALPLEPLEDSLFQLLRRHRVDEALAELEARCPAEQLSELPQKARFWLMRSVELGFWLGLEDDGCASVPRCPSSRSW
jgi:hypothetical protein